MTRAELRGEVRGNIKRTASGIPDSRINTWLNWSQSTIADWHTYEEMRNVTTIATIANQRRYPFPDRMKDIYSITLQADASSCKLRYVNSRSFDLGVPNPSTVTIGKPSLYVDYGVNFELHRIPDAIYTLNIRYSAFPIDFPDDGASSELLRKDALICSVATSFGFNFLREIEDAAHWKQNVTRELFSASLAADHSAEDWVPIARGFGLVKPRISTPEIPI